MPNANVVGEVKCSEAMYDDSKARRQGQMWKTGHSLIKAKMKEEPAELAGEMSGHMFYATASSGTTTRSTPARGCSS